MMTMRMFLSEQEQIPWPALEYVIGQINYGGRVTDDLDRRCLMSILRQYVTPQVLDDAYRLTPSGTYYVPPDGDLDSYREYIRGLPVTEAPEVFGMHPNANISFQLQETRRLIETILSIQVCARLPGRWGERSVCACWDGEQQPGAEQAVACETLVHVRVGRDSNRHLAVPRCITPHFRTPLTPAAPTQHVHALCHSLA